MRILIFYPIVTAIVATALLLGHSVETPAQLPQFVDATESAGVAFRHVNGARGDKHFIETIGSGACFFDYNNDGWIDLYAVSSRPLPGAGTGEKVTNRLYRNNGNGTFSDVTDQARVGGGEGYGMGCVAADYDNDGHEDLFVTNFGASVLYHNTGKGTFTDVTARAGVAGSGWQTGCAFGDYDGDGHLDLFVSRYVSYTLAERRKKLIPYTTRQTRGVADVPAYPAPMNFPGSSCILYRNQGDGTFTDVTRAAGVYNPAAKAFQAMFSDLDGDGRPDILVANDEEKNFLYRNRGDGTFEDLALLAGIAYDAEGMTRAGMGADIGDYDGDARFDIAMTNFRYQGILIFRNDGDLSFTDVSMPTGVGPPSLPYVAWGVGLFDFDNDGWPDLYVANGHVLDNPEVFDPTAEHAEPNLLLRNTGAGGKGPVAFTDVSKFSGPGLQLKKVSRGVAFGDYDNDGDVDLFVVNNNQRADLLRNEGPIRLDPGGGSRNHWVTVKLVGGMKATGDRAPSASRLSNRDGIGARVTVTAGGRRQTREVRAGSSYLSCNDRRLHFGLGRSTRVDRIEVQWPGGGRTRIQDLPADQAVTLEEGAGPVK